MTTVWIALWILAGMAVSVFAAFTFRNNERLRAELKDCHLTLESNRGTIQRQSAHIREIDLEEFRWKQIAISEASTLTADRDKWQVECAKLRATVERQAGDIVRLETSVKTAQRGNAVRASNR